MKCLLHFCLAALLVTASAYTPYERGQDGIGAMGERVLPGKTAAVSRDLRHLLGKWVSVKRRQEIRQRCDGEEVKRKMIWCVGGEKKAREWGRQGS